MSDCKCGGKCKIKALHLKENRAAKTRTERMQGREFTVVPVIMARADTPMNGVLYPAEELHPIAWNGVPVTASHPEEKGDFLSANSPKVLDKWQIGQIFNCSVTEDGVLKGEAYIDNKLARKVSPNLLKSIDGGKEIDVSVGLYSEDTEQAGKLNGKEYSIVARNLQPDHLAVLLEEPGACSFAEGCGIRDNKKAGVKMKPEEILANIAKLIKANAEEDSGAKDKDAMVNAIIASESSPFKEAEKDQLMGMSDETVKAMADQYGVEDEASNNEEEDEEKVAASEEDKPKENEDEGDMPKANASGLSAEDRALLKGAIEAAKTITTNARKPKELRVCSALGLDEAVVAKMDGETLDALFQGLPAEEPTFYGASPVAHSRNTDDDKDEIEAMASAGGVVAQFRKNKKEA